MENENLLKLNLKEIIEMQKQKSGCLHCTQLLHLNDSDGIIYACSKLPNIQSTELFIANGTATTCDDYATRGNNDTLEQLLNAREKAKLKNERKEAI